ncbi:hypothetical protein I4F81_007713 [Pyropia yezoensis]|uniref:Uncharacterized protein n=1 Tax=Pyropia yezoensis TaxID=2788 RepID=A0ACC3C537_PYRYE|nr:hypothetical protein I4F81_007713 [Neopyropia yezoensis]
MQRSPRRRHCSVVGTGVIDAAVRVLLPPHLDKRRHPESQGSNVSSQAVRRHPRADVVQGERTPARSGNRRHLAGAQPERTGAARDGESRRYMRRGNRLRSGDEGTVCTSILRFSQVCRPHRQLRRRRSGDIRWSHQCRQIQPIVGCGATHASVVSQCVE